MPRQILGGKVNIEQSSKSIHQPCLGGQGGSNLGFKPQGPGFESQSFYIQEGKRGRDPYGAITPKRRLKSKIRIKIRTYGASSIWAFHRHMATWGFITMTFYTGEKDRTQYLNEGLSVKGL